MQQIQMTNQLTIARLLVGLTLPILSAVGVEAATLELWVVDSNGRPLPCRVLVRPQGSACLVPEGAVELKIGPDQWFMSSGRSSLEVPQGKVELRIERGLEYTRVKEILDISEPTTPKRVTLRRWIDMKSRGYLSGENHLHVDSKALGPMLAAEDLDFGTSLQWWNRPRFSVPAGDGPIRNLEFGGKSTPSSMYDAEVEYAWGAVYLLHLPSEMKIPSHENRSNLEFVRHTHGAGGIVCYQGGWSRQVAVDALLGLVHMVNVCNNNFHLHRFQPRRRYSNLLEVPDFPLYPNTPQGMMKMNTDTYYRLLNWGLRLAAGAGSATGVKQVPAGYNRAYVRRARDASIQDFYQAWIAGRNFVTNGPMLFLETEEGHKPGDTIELPTQGGRVKLKLTALSDQPLTSLELIVNGQRTALPIRSDRETVAETEMEIREGSWIAARCAVRDDWLTDEELNTYANAPRELPSRLRFAHTSPIYVTAGGKGAAVPESIQEGLQMLDRFERFAHRQAGSDHRSAILKATAEARRKLQEKLQ